MLIVVDIVSFHSLNNHLKRWIRFDLILEFRQCKAISITDPDILSVRDPDLRSVPYYG